MRVDAFIAMGSNLGDRHQYITSAIESVDLLKDTTVIEVSQLIETEPVGPGVQGSYINGVMHVQTSLSARELLESLLDIEKVYGRDRSTEQRWGARTLDLDVLLYGEEIIQEEGLEVPHPRLGERIFVLEPLCEIAPDVKIPGYKKTPRELLRVLIDSESD